MKYESLSEQVKTLEDRHGYCCAEIARLRNQLDNYKSMTDVVDAWAKRVSDLEADKQRLCATVKRIAHLAGEIK